MSSASTHPLAIGLPGSRLFADIDCEKEDEMITGECFCGGVKYQVDGQLLDPRSCHCSRCRKAFSAQASAYALVEPDTFSWIKGEENLTSFVSEKGEGYQFCRTCGSTLCGLMNGEVHGITLGCLNENPKIQLARHIFVGSKASWEDISGDVPQYEEAYSE